METTETYIIYLATNLINGKQYVGQTKTWRFGKRCKEHIMAAMAGDRNVAFHNALCKYGISNFKFEIIERDISAAHIDERECFWISYYNTYIHAKNSNGYNETWGGQGMRGYIFTAEDREKMSIKQKAYWASLKENNRVEYDRLCEIRRNNKLGIKWTSESRKKLSDSCKGRTPWNKNLHGYQKAWNKGQSKYPNVCQYDLSNGKLLAIFSNATIAAEAIFPNKANLKTQAERISGVCIAGKGHSYGYIWRFDVNCAQLSAEELAVEHRSPRAKRVVQLDLSGNVVAEFDSAASYAKSQTDDKTKQRNIAKTINETCRGAYKTYKGFIWKYK